MIAHNNLKEILLTFYLDCAMLDEYRKESFEELWVSSTSPPPPKETPETLRNRLEYLQGVLSNIKDKFIFASSYEYSVLYEALTDPILAKIKKIRYKLRDGLRVIDNSLPAIKAIPIKQVLEAYGIKTINQYGNRLKFAIRNERTASCTAYIDQNSWWDYGSSAGGSVIDLVMNIEQCSVSEAINKLKKLL